MESKFELKEDKIVRIFTEVKEESISSDLIKEKIKECEDMIRTNEFIINNCKNKLEKLKLELVEVSSLELLKK